MDYQCKAESGLQLLARLSTRPNIHALNDRLFSAGLNFGDVVEISGDLGTGKTILVTQILAKCLLPKSMCETHIDGLGAGAILINCDHHFQLLKLVSLMESMLLKIQKPGCSSTEQNQSLDSSTIEKIIKAALANLTILNCYDRVQLLVTFHSLGNILSSNTDISLIVLDSISAYYWQDVVISGKHKMDFYLKKTLKTLQTCVKDYKIVTIFTKQAYFHSKIGFASDSSSKQTIGSITHRVTLNRLESSESEGPCFAEVTTLNSKQIVPYQISAEGIIWLE